MVPIILSFGLLTTILFVIYQWISEYVMLRKALKAVPGPKNFPFIGIVSEFNRVPREDKFQWLNNLCFQYDEGIVVTWIGADPFVTIRKPQHMETILSSNTLLTKSNIYDVMKPWLGEGLVTSTGDTWFTHRKLITPAFHFGVLEEYAVVMREKIKILCECIQAHVQANPKKPVNIFGLAVKYTLDTICETAMGIDINSQRSSDNAYVKAVHTFSHISSERISRPWLKWDFIFFRTQWGRDYLNSVKIMHDFTEKVITHKQLQRKEKISADKEETDEFDVFGKRKRKAFLDLLLDSSTNTKNPLTNKEIQEEVDTFMFAGHDTTSAAISWALFALGNAPHVQAKVHEELKETFGNNKEISTTKQLGQLKYLDRVIKEVLRLYPSAPKVGRCLDHDATFDNYTIPKGTIINIHIYQLHHDPKIWKDPETFDPDRFLPENCLGRHPYAYVPFSAGPRNCIGQKFAILELKIALTEILRRWRVSSVLKPSEIKLVLNFILRPHNEAIELNFTPINDV